MAANPWQAAAIGLAQTVVVLAGMILFGSLLNIVARLFLRRSRDEWRLLRIDRFWLVNTLLAPLMLALFAAFAWLFHLSLDEMGFNLKNLGMSQGIGIPLGLLLGLPSAVAAPIAARQGLSPMRVPFGRTLFDTVGAIGYAAILVGPLEEIPFRGIIQTLLMRAMPQQGVIGPFSIALGTFVAAFVFVLYHYRNVMLGGESQVQFLRQVPGRMVASFILAFLYQGTGSLLGPVLFHNILDTCTIASLSISMYRLRKQGKLPPTVPPPATTVPPLTDPSEHQAQNYV
jgi:membrane protease YdiL (CAAX protease family)